MIPNTLRLLLERYALARAAFLAGYRLVLPRRYHKYLLRAKREVNDWGLEELTAMDMCRETLLYGTFYEEYRLFRFDQLSNAQRRTYLTDAVRNSICLKINDKQCQQMLLDKYSCYLHFQPYYRRKAIRVASEEDRSQFMALVCQCQELVMKPLCNCAGRGVALVNDFDELPLGEGPLIVEERIVQEESMAKWHPASVNTVRMNTVLNQGNYTLMNCFLRTGRGGAFVDNGAQGGLFALIDPVTGMIVTDGYDERGLAVTMHPDSHIPYRGTSIPQWASLCALAEELARSIPQLVYVAWDFALTLDGWVMVEANKGQFVAQQVLMKRGLRADFEKLVL